MNIVDNAKIWVSVLISPRQIFKRERAYADLKYAFSNIFAAAAIATLFKIILSGVSATVYSNSALLTKQLHTLGAETTSALTPANTAILALTNFAAIFLLLLLMWGIGGWIIGFVSKRFTGQGNLAAHLYLTSLFMPAFAVAGTFLSYVGSAVIVGSATTVSYRVFSGMFYVWAGIVALVVLYIAYEYILALAETYKYGEGAALASFAIGAIITGILLVVVIISPVGALLGLLFI